MAPREPSRAAGELLRRSLADAVQADGLGKGCPSPDMLAAYYERSLDAGETARYELHFSQCPRCREQLAALERAGESAAAPVEARRPAASWAWLWNWRWLAPATAAALVITVVWVARRPAATQTAREQSPTLVAEYKQPEPPAPITEKSEQKAAPETQMASPRESSVATPPARAIPAPAGEIQHSAASERVLAPAPAKAPAQNAPMVGRDHAETETLTKTEQLPNHGMVGRAIGAPTADAARIAPQPAATSAASPSAPVPSSEERGATASEQVTAEAEAPAVAAAKSKTAAPIEAKAMRSAAPMANNYSARAESVVALSADELSAPTLIRTPNPNVLWRVMPGGIVEHSLDAGATWQQQALSALAKIVAGTAPTVRICWLVGRSGTILVTRDGTKWETVTPPMAADFVAVSAQDASSATVTAADGRRFSTTDGGMNWNALP